MVARCLPRAAASACALPRSWHIREGKLADGRLYFDVATMMSQLGPGPEAPGAEAATESSTDAKASPEARRH